MSLLLMSSTLDELWDAAAAIKACEDGLVASEKWKGKGYSIADYCRLSTEDLSYNPRYNSFLLQQGIANILPISVEVQDGLLESLIERDPMLAYFAVRDSGAHYDARLCAQLKAALKSKRIEIAEKHPCPK